MERSFVVKRGQYVKQVSKNKASKVAGLPACSGKKLFINVYFFYIYFTLIYVTVCDFYGNVTPFR